MLPSFFLLLPSIELNESLLLIYFSHFLKRKEEEGGEEEEKEIDSNSRTFNTALFFISIR